MHCLKMMKKNYGKFPNNYLCVASMNVIAGRTQCNDATLRIQSRNNVEIVSNDPTWMIFKMDPILN